MKSPTVIDLTVRLSEDTPVYPGDPAIKIATIGEVDRDGYAEHLVTLATHIGTHLDAPAHMLSGGHTLAHYPTTRFTGRGVYVDVRTGFHLSKITRLGIRAGDIVLLHTGMDRAYGRPAYFTDFPHVPREVAEYFVECGISMVGMDACGPDEPPFPVHQVLLQGDVLILENLTALDRLRGQTFQVMAFPISMDLDGAPVRAVAMVDGSTP